MKKDLIDDSLTALINAETSNSVSWCLGDTMCNREGKYQNDTGEKVECTTNMYCPMKNYAGDCRCYEFQDMTSERSRKNYVPKRATDRKVA